MTFQSYISAIKTTHKLMMEIGKKIFQSYISAIKTKPFWRGNPHKTTYFNPTLVRLKPDFDANSVELKPHFNPTLGRLKRPSHIIIPFKKNKFQSYISAIKTSLGSGSISIVDTGFQSYISAIKTTKNDYPNAPDKSIFQSYISAIKTKVRRPI